MQVTTDSGLTRSPTKPQPAAPTLSNCEPYREFIQESLGRGRNATAIYQDLVTDYGFPHSYQSVKRFVNKLCPPELKPARAVIITEPGEEAQVDYGTGPWVRDPQSGKYRRTRLFVMTLGYSRKCVRLLTFRSSSRIWAELHEKAFRRLGGSVRVVVLDNLREGVLKADIHDPTLNPLYRDVLAHYGAVALPCRVKDPDRKGKVEAGVGHAQKTPLKGNASRVWKRRRLISIVGRQTGPTPAFTAPPNDKWPRCLPKSVRTCCRYHSSPSAFMNMASA